MTNYHLTPPTILPSFAIQEAKEKRRRVLEEELKASEERIKTELKQAIDTSQEDTIEALSEVIHTGYNMHEERIKHLEDQARVYNSLVHPHLSC